MISILVPDILDKILRVPEPPFSHFPILLLPRRVTTQSQNVGTSSLVGSMEGGVDLLARHVGTGQVHTGFQSVYGLSHIDHFTRQIGVSTPGAPSDIDERGAKSVHAVHSVVEVLHTLSRLRREEFEGDAGPPCGFILGDLVLDMHLEDYAATRTVSAIGTQFRHHCPLRMKRGRLINLPISLISSI